MKKIFSQIHENILLELIKYNKKFQKVLNKGITNYKMLRGISIILESNDKGKEYDNYKNRVIFEGEYKNLKRNGKGKEYNNEGKILFEGEYLNNKRNGKGKEYFSNGNIKFEGEYLNGRRWNGKGYDKNNQIMFEIKNGNGHVKEYVDFESDLIFEGEYLNGEKNGKGKEYYENIKLTFEGEYLNGKRHGKGNYYYPKNKMGFEGEYFNDKEWNGKRYDQEGNIMYELKNGKGIKKFYFSGFDFTSEYNENPTLERLILLSECEYLNGERNGKGKEYDFNGVLDFEGEYLNDKRNGKGKEYKSGMILNSENRDYNNNKEKKGDLIFEGEYLYGHRKLGKEYENKKLIYEGEYLYERKWNGKGYDKKGNIIYELINGNGKVKEYSEDNPKLLIFDGEYINGIKKGICKEYINCLSKNPDLIFEGEYYNDNKNGKGKEYNKEGELIFEGEYKEGKRWNGKGKEYNNKKELIFEGEYLNGERWNGKGKEYFKFTNELNFVGKYINGKKNGIGKEIGKDNMIYNIKYINGKVVKNKNCIIY